MNEDLNGAVDGLLTLNENELYSVLGARLSAVIEDPKKGGELSLEVQMEEGPFDENSFVMIAGKRIFENLSVAAYNLVCGDDENHKELMVLVDKGTTALAAGIAGLLIAQLGIAAAIATAVAALVVKLFFTAAGKGLCETWKDFLPKPQASDPTP
jgi:hypothetical protein